ncbi:hypothetical protein V8E36_007297 [Tilletia maclaganii]
MSTAAIEHRSGRFDRTKEAYDDLAVTILGHHRIRIDRRSGIRPWTQLNRIYKRESWRIDGGYFIHTHLDFLLGHWVEAIPQIGARSSVSGRRSYGSDDSDDDAATITDYDIFVRQQSSMASRAGRDSDSISVSDIISLFSQLSVENTKLEVLQIVLRALDERDIPDTITQCRQRLKRIHVNIWDLAPVVRSEMDKASKGDDDEETHLPLARNTRVPRYTIKALINELQIQPRRRFPIRKAKDETLQDLLRLVFG